MHLTQSSQLPQSFDRRMPYLSAALGFGGPVTCIYVRVHIDTNTLF